MYGKGRLVTKSARTHTNLSLKLVSDNDNRDYHVKEAINFILLSKSIGNDWRWQYLTI